MQQNSLKSFGDIEEKLIYTALASKLCFLRFSEKGNILNYTLLCKWDDCRQFAASQKSLGPSWIKIQKLKLVRGPERVV